MAALTEPRRRQLFDLVVRAERPLTRDEVALRAGIDRALAAHHLDRLAEAGLLDVSFARPPERPGGPGAGRPAKRYAPAAPEVTLSVPPRRYDLAARLLARAVLADGDAAQALPAVARAEGRRLASEHSSSGTDAMSTLVAVLADLDYRPRADETGVRLANCPFHALLEVSVDLICGANRSFCAGLLDGLGADDLRAVLDPEPGPECCVRVEHTGSASPDPASTGPARG